MKVGDLIRLKDKDYLSPAWAGQLCIVTELTDGLVFVKRLHDGFVGSISSIRPPIEPAGGEDEADHN